ncbi:hypothetical protein RhiirA5_452829 [Rhizophagus irregularis]|uniref:RBR-type E3 ubiquitin transferase n=4 Tax=Rhizophagus irregularis TaxID=588596 RepID=A0A2I1E5N0_9GLOM|nr:hypothetical protein RhiirA5_452829 [Rhizophagus irregularis]GBC11589.1 hypothetical protein GLOIN_2v1763580 [Rhizophagus irregularis DAOM 181602=DAOM 197198]PKC66356.1 hypothetical protein RhiirA1_441755 [Rhizophagus irregularis]PKY17433.1 hypothetical protein RhiirB3_365304 [Rhizophagus irregularis]UZO05010.1 hypothetical protein OCT59_025371 [Rhizophagus irregularis]
MMKEECQICFELLPRHLFLQVTADCNHELDVCKLCVDKHIQAQLESKGNIEICCPSSGCKKELQHRDIKRIASKQAFERYDKLMLTQTLSKLPEFRWCKNSRCGAGQINFEGDASPIMTCESCGQKYCYTHDVPWHKGLTCSEYNNRKLGEDKATKSLLERETKSCPKCGVRITKNGGCDHMTCTVKHCKYEFCWLCFADYNEIRRNGNKSHRRTCKLYA